jgi:hypothetical protein
MSSIIPTEETGINDKGKEIPKRQWINQAA